MASSYTHSFMASNVSNTGSNVGRALCHNKTKGEFIINEPAEPKVTSRVTGYMNSYVRLNFAGFLQFLFKII